MCDQVSSCGPSRTTSCNVFDSAIVIPSPSFFAVHVENIYKFRAKPASSFSNSSLTIRAAFRSLLINRDREAETQLAHLLAHIRQCAPCFDELKELRQKGRIQTP